MDTSVNAAASAQSISEANALDNANMSSPAAAAESDALSPAEPEMPGTPPNAAPLQPASGTTAEALQLRCQDVIEQSLKVDPTGLGDALSLLTQSEIKQVSAELASDSSLSAEVMLDSGTACCFVLDEGQLAASMDF